MLVMETPTAISSVTTAVGSASGVDNAHWLRAFAKREDFEQEPKHLVEFRKAAIDHLKATSFPTRREEDWKYSDFTRELSTEKYSLTEVDAPPFKRNHFEIPEFHGHVLVTIDGEYVASLSDTVPDLEIGSITEFLERESHGAWIQECLTDLSQTSASAFVALNAAFAKTGIYLAAKRNVKADKPIHIIHFATRSKESRMICSQVMINMPQGAELTVDETFETLGTGENIFRNHLVRANLSAQSRLAFRSIQNESRTDFHVSNFGASQQSGSYFDHVRVDLGGAQVRNNLDIHHKGPGLESKMSGLYFARDTQKIDNQTFIDHAFPHGESQELYKGIVMDRGVTSFNGKVMVRPDAQKTNAFQQNDNLVIGEFAEANAKPQLEIFADDVKCSHGATIGQLDHEPLYYLMARGIDRGTALGMLQRGFLLEVLETIESDSVRAYVENLLMAKFNE